jgi:hypothetical protein
MLYGEPGYGEKEEVEIPPTPEEIRMMRLRDEIVEFMKNNMIDEVFDILENDYFTIEMFEDLLPKDLEDRLNGYILVVNNDPY